PDTARGGELFHTRRQVGGLADGGVIHVQVVTNRSHHDFPRVEPHACLHLQAVGAADFLSVAVHGGLHGQGPRTGPHHVVFVGHWGTEERHDTVTKYLVHGALVAVHRLHHDVECRIEQPPGLFRIEIAD